MYLPPKADDRKGRRHVCSLLNTYCPFHVISINSPSLPCAMSVIAPMCVRYHSFCHFEYQSFQELRRHHRTSPTGVLGLSFCTLRIHRLLIDQSKLDSWAYLTPDPLKWDRARITNGLRGPMLQQTHTYGTSRATPQRAKCGLELWVGELRPFQYTNASRTERSDAVVSGCRSEEADGGEIIVS